MAKVALGGACILLSAAVMAPLASADEVIVVTGERRPQSDRAISGAVAVMSGDDVARIDPQVAGEALNRLPGVAIHRNNGVENLPAIRSPVLNGGQSAGSFLVLEDGVPIRAPGFSNVNQLWETSLDFAARVEVVRGPGSALYGSNAVHGLVNVITPVLCAMCQDGLNGTEARVSVGSFERAAASVLTGVSMAGNGSEAAPHLLAGVALQHEGGWRDQSGLDRQDGLLGLDGDLGGWAMQARLAVQNLNQETAGFIVGPDAYKDEALARANPTPESYRDTQLVRGRVQLERKFGDGLTMRVTPYARWIDADLNLSFLPSRAQELTTQTGGGVQSALYWDRGDTLSFIVGGDWDYTRGELYEFQSLPDLPNGYVMGLHYDYAVDMQVAALFAQASWAFAPDWRLNAGLRGERVSYDYDNHAPASDVGRFRRPADREDEFDALLPKLGVVWSLAEAQSVWVNYARGARPPQITDLYSLQTTQTVGEQDMETLDSVELGWRGALGPGSFEVALYHMDKEDTSFRNADGFTVTNGATRHQGIEASAAMPLTDTLSLAGWVTYARHTYRFDDTSSRAGESISSGDDVDSAPRWIWNTRLEWRPTSRVRAELEWVHMGAYFTNAANTARYDGHDVLNLRAEWDAPGRATLFAAVRNLADVAYAERADFAFGSDRFFPGEPLGATVGVRVAR